MKKDKIKNILTRETFKDYIKKDNLSWVEENWICDNGVLINRMYPMLTIEKIVSKLKAIIKENLKVEEVYMNDNYRNKVYKSDTIKLIEFIRKKKALTAGNGVLIDRDARNPAIKMLNTGAEKRAEFKARMKSDEVVAGSYEFNMLDLYQNNEKKKLNAW